MPKIKITEAFNYQSGGETKRYDKGEYDVPQAVVDHALAKGFSPKPKDDIKPQATPQAQAPKS